MSDVLIVSSVVVVEPVDRPSIQQVAWQAPKCKKVGVCSDQEGCLVKAEKVFLQARKVLIQAKKASIQGKERGAAKDPV